MELERREFLHAAAGAAILAGTRATASAAGDRGPLFAPSRAAGRAPLEAGAAASYEPWLEIDAAALHHNAREIARLAGNLPVLAVIKNNAYGLGVARVGTVLETSAAVSGFAVVKPEEALALRNAGVRKPILLMGLADVETGIELASRDVQLAAFTDDAGQRLTAVARAIGRPVSAHLYVDTGMSRMGLPHQRALPWAEALTREPHIRVEGTFTELAEIDDFDDAQVARFDAFARAARGRGIALGALHVSSSHALFFRPGARFDMVRPGLVLYGAYPAGARTTALAALRPAFRLRARVVRVERVEAGDGVSYGRNYVAQRPTWIATLAVGHADGYPRRAVQGAEVLVGDRLYRVIGAVSASHTILEIGDEPTIEIGDVATLVGPDHESVLPNTLAERAGISVYDVLMHLSAELAKR
ncbi:MAG TPA: alanine racemase [Gemmatimonadaceae bacterium]|nr:alanine racemase [Gemmatimonadaceae bacterium]